VNAVSRVAVIGEGVRVQGFALAGALVFAAEDQAAAQAAWRSLPTDAEVAVLTPAAARWLADALSGDSGMHRSRAALPRRPGVLTVVMPEAGPRSAPHRAPGAPPETSPRVPPGGAAS
jgi:hypothetical protein